MIAVAGALALASSFLESGMKNPTGLGDSSSDSPNFASFANGGKETSDQAERKKLLHSLAPAKDSSLLYLEISGDAAFRLHEAGALFIDARHQESYLKNHITKAINIPAWGGETDEGIRALQENGAAFDDVIVVYCSGSDCSDSLALSEKLAMQGYLNLYIYKMGFPEWQENGWPIAAGKNP